jgi:hypothetical protein
MQKLRPVTLSAVLLAGALSAHVFSFAPAFALPPTPAAPAKSEARIPVGDAAVVDFERGVLEAAGSAAADLFSASAEIARLKAERLARLRAEERLRKALQTLAQDEKQRGRLQPFGGPEAVSRLDPTQARVLVIDYGASGSVSLRLELPLAGGPAAAVDLGSRGTPDGGADLGGARGTGK